MQLSPQEKRQIMQVWSRDEAVIKMVFDKLYHEYTEQLQRQDSEWETLRGGIELTAKRQALNDFKNILSKNYATTFGE